VLLKCIAIEHVSHISARYKIGHLCPSILFCFQYFVHKLHYKFCDVRSVGHQILEDNFFCFTESSIDEP